MEAHQDIMNFLAFDISESLYEFLDEERKAEAKLTERKKELLEAIEGLDGKLTKLTATQAIDPTLTENEDINTLKSNISERIEKLKDLYNKLDIVAEKCGEDKDPEKVTEEECDCGKPDCKTCNPIDEAASVTEIKPGDAVTCTEHEGTFKVDSLTSAGVNLTKEGEDGIISVPLASVTLAEPITDGSDVPPILVDPTTGDDANAAVNNDTPVIQEGLQPGDTVTVTDHEGSFKVDSLSALGANLTKEGEDGIINIPLSDITIVEPVVDGSDVPPIQVDPATGADTGDAVTNEGINSGDTVTVSDLEGEYQVQSIDADAGFAILMDPSGSTHQVAVEDINVSDTIVHGDEAEPIVTEASKFSIAASVKSGEWEGRSGNINPSDYAALGDDDDIEILFSDEDKPSTVKKGNITADLSESNMLELFKAFEKSPIVNEAELMDEETGKVVKLPYKTKDFRGDPITVKGFTEPHKSSSSGRIQTDKGEYFPGVAGLKIIGHQFES
jgi:hypothetical protein